MIASKFCLWFLIFGYLPQNCFTSDVRVCCGIFIGKFDERNYIYCPGCEKQHPYIDGYTLDKVLIDCNQNTSQCSQQKTLVQRGTYKHIVLAKNAFEKWNGRAVQISRISNMIIDDWAFNGSSIDNVLLWDGLKRVRAEMFRQEKPTISVMQLLGMPQVIFLPSNMLKYLPNLRSLRLWDFARLEKMPSDIFQGDTLNSLSLILLRDAVIPKDIFRRMTNLKELQFYNNLHNFTCAHASYMDKLEKLEVHVHDIEAGACLLCAATGRINYIRVHGKQHTNHWDYFEISKPDNTMRYKDYQIPVRYKDYQIPAGLDPPQCRAACKGCRKSIPKINKPQPKPKPAPTVATAPMCSYGHGNSIHHIANSKLVNMGIVMVLVHASVVLLL